MDENNKFDVVGTNIAEKATMIWNVADMLRGPFKPHEYGLVILPMTVVKRFHDCLLPTHKAVLEQYEKVKNFAVIDGFLTKASGYQFYNISKYTFESLLADPENIEANFRDYLNGFSANVQDVLAKFDFDNIIRRMVESNTLYLVIKEFNSQKGYLGPDKISAVDCGYIFEDLVKRFSESFGEEAGAHFTSRDIIYLMTDLLLSDADLSKGGNVTVYDMAMGTSQMLSCMEERIQELNTEIGVTCFGQEFNPSTFAIAKADMMIRGGDPNNMRFGDTLSEDQFSGYQFQYIISNPPFGIDWKREKTAVEAEAKKGELGRFAPGLPKISDGQQLLWKSAEIELYAKAAYEWKYGSRKKAYENTEKATYCMIFNEDTDKYMMQQKIREHTTEESWKDFIINILINMPDVDMEIAEWVKEFFTIFVDVCKNCEYKISPDKEIKDTFKIKRNDNKSPDFKKISLKKFFEKKNEEKYTRSSIHGVKGESYEAVLLHVKSRTGSTITPKLLMEGELEQELMRLAYVAMTRPRRLLMLAMPDTKGIKTCGRFSEELWTYENL